MNSREISPDSSFPAPLREFHAVVCPYDYTALQKCSCAKFGDFENRHGKQSLLDIVTMVLTEICECLNFTISGRMITTAAQLITEEYPDTLLADLKLFAKMVLTGRLGDSLYRLDTEVFMQLWKRYYSNREDAIEPVRISGMQVEEKFALPPSREEHIRLQEQYKKMKLEAEAKRKTENHQHEVKSLYTLQSYCEDQGLDYDLVMQTLFAQAEEKHKESEGAINKDALFHILENQTLIEAKRNPDYLTDFKINHNGT